MQRKILAVLIGMLVGGVFNMALVSVSNTLYPLPPDIDPEDFEAFRRYVEIHGLPTGAMLIVLLAHAGGSFVSGFVCGLIAKHRWYIAAAAMGILWTFGGITMLALLPAPAWFATSDVLLYLPSALLGVNLGGAISEKPTAAPSRE